MSDNDQLDLMSFSKKWTSDDAPAMNDPVSALRQAKRKQFVRFAIDLGVSLTGLLVGATLLVSQDCVKALLVFCFSLIGLAITFFARWRSWRIPSGTVQGEYDLSIRLARTQIRIGWTGLVLCACTLLFLASLIALDGPRFSSPEFRTAIVVSLMFIAAVTMITVRSMISAIGRVNRLEDLQLKPLRTEEAKTTL